MLFSIGHSNHDFSKFWELLAPAKLDYLVDVRSYPVSSRYPWFSKDELSENLRALKIKYLFQGKSLGGRPKSAAEFYDNIADYEVMSKREDFKEVISKLSTFSMDNRIGLLCSEHDPLDCHRCLMVSRAFLECGLETQHLLKDGSSILQSQIEQQLVQNFHSSNHDLFMSSDEVLNAAYKKRAMQIAYTRDAEAKVL